MAETMHGKSRFWWRSSLPFAFVVVVLVSAWSWLVQPETAQLDFARIPVSTESRLLLTNKKAPEPRNLPCAAWRLHLRIDSDLSAPGPSWVMFSGERLGQGYELHWNPARLSLTLLRSQAPIVLGAAEIDHMPEQVMLIRLGWLVRVVVDGHEVMTLTDAAAPSATTVWGFQASGPMESSTISLFDERRPEDDTVMRALADDTAALRTILNASDGTNRIWIALRQALLLDPEKSTTDRLQLLQRCKKEIGTIPQGETAHADAALWLAWGMMHQYMDRTNVDETSAAHKAMQEFIHLAQQSKQPAPGLALELLDSLSRRASTPLPRAPAAVLQWRTQWLGMLTDAIHVALENKATPLASDWLWQLRLLDHAAGCVRGLPGKPTPAEAPEWVAVRWRIFASAIPGSTSLPPLPNPNGSERNPIRMALDRLIALAALEPGGLSAINLRASILAALTTPPPPNAGQEGIKQQQIENREAAYAVLETSDAPTREVALTRAILALYNIGDLQRALEGLDHDPQHRLPTGDGSVPLARRDPLAFALYRLLVHRLVHNGVVPATGPFTAPHPIPDALVSQYGRLLSGSADATSEIAWIPDPNILPPVQLLCAALAMQEVMGVDGVTPDWALLERLPCFTLPLRLLQPGYVLNTIGSQATTAPPVVP